MKWKILLKKYEVSEDVVRSLSEVAKECHKYNLEGVCNNPDI